MLMTVFGLNPSAGTNLNYHPDMPVPTSGSMQVERASNRWENGLLFKEGVDGVIHIFPFTCMPELVAQTILSKVQKDLHIPILTLIIDEHTGRGGVESRLEAFIDLLERRRRRK